jgi:hypothetical protein
MMTDPTKSSAATAAGIAADYSARATYARGYEDGSKHVDEVGIQLAALRERLRLAMDAARKLKAFRDGIAFKVDDERGVHSLRSIVVNLERLWSESADALAALDAVPGDALPHGALASSGRLDALDARWVGPDGEPER